jgi:hypothetical protein
MTRFPDAVQRAAVHRRAGTVPNATVILRSVPSWARVSKDGHTHFVSILRDAAQARGSSG